MNDKITTLGIPFEIASEDDLIQFSIDELKEPVLHAIYALSTSQTRYALDEILTLTKQKGITWIPVGEGFSSILPKKYRHVVSEFSVEDYLDRLYEYAIDNGIDVCMLLDKKSDKEMIMEHIRSSFPYLSIQMLDYESFVSEEAIVNEINTTAPEILILGFQTETMCSFLAKNRSRTNSRLCICVGSMIRRRKRKKKNILHRFRVKRQARQQLKRYETRKKNSK